LFWRDVHEAIPGDRERFHEFRGRRDVAVEEETVPLLLVKEEGPLLVSTEDADSPQEDKAKLTKTARKRIDFFFESEVFGLRMTEAFLRTPLRFVSLNFTWGRRGSKEKSKKREKRSLLLLSVQLL
jgi:hypothetical protein